MNHSKKFFFFFAVDKNLVSLSLFHVWQSERIKHFHNFEIREKANLTYCKRGRGKKRMSENGSRILKLWAVQTQL